MTERLHRPRTNPVPVGAITGLGVILAVIVLLAFTGSAGALYDAAIAAHFRWYGALGFPLVVDGLLAFAILAAVLLRHDTWARRQCQAIVAFYSAASWYINWLHGQGRVRQGQDGGGASWYVAALIAFLLIAAIFLGSHLLVSVARHVWPQVMTDVAIDAACDDATPVEADQTPVALPAQSNVEAAAEAYRLSKEPGRERLSQAKLVERFAISVRQARKVQRDVDAEPTQPPELITQSRGELNGSTPADGPAVTA